MLGSVVALMTMGSVPHISATTTYIAAPLITLSEMEAAERKRRHKYAPICQNILHKQKRLDDAISQLNGDDILYAAYYMREGEYGCRKNPKLAATLLDRYITRAPFHVPVYMIGDAVKFWSETDPVGARDRIKELNRIRWVRGDPDLGGDALLDWTEAERRAFIARDDVWAFLLQPNVNHWQRNTTVAGALFDPLSPRYDPAAGVAFVESNFITEYNYTAAMAIRNGLKIDNGHARAEILLQTAARFNPEAARAFIALMQPRLESPDADTQQKAADALLTLTQHNSGGATEARAALIPYFAARLTSTDAAISGKASVNLLQFYRDRAVAAEEPLLPWLDQRLKSGDVVLKSQSLSILSALTIAGSTTARAMIDADIARAGGAIDYGLISTKNGLNPALIGPDDYPARALQQQEEGVVSARLLVGPDGRAIEGIIMQSASPRLDEAVIRTTIRRFRLKMPEYAGRYVWVQLPDVQFRLPACEEGQAVQPIQPEALLVEGYCARTVF
jgi:hypothetical protein